MPLGAAPADYPPVSVPMTAQQVAPDVYVVQGMAGGATEHEGFISNSGFVVTNAGVVVLDALGSPSLAAKATWKGRVNVPAMASADDKTSPKEPTL